MKFDFEIQGARELDDVLKQLPPAVSRRVAANALRAAGRVIRDEAQSIVRRIAYQTGDLMRSIRVMTVRAERGGEERAVRVAVAGKELPLAHLVEFGTVPIRRSPKGGFMYFMINGRLIRKKEVRGVGKRPFLRPAADAKAREVITILGQMLGDGVVKEALKLKRRR